MTVHTEVWNCLPDNPAFAFIAWLPLRTCCYLLDEKVQAISRGARGMIRPKISGSLDVKACRDSFSNRSGGSLEDSSLRHLHHDTAVEGSIELYRTLIEDSYTHFFFITSNQSYSCRTNQVQVLNHHAHCIEDLRGTGARSRFLLRSSSWKS